MNNCLTAIELAGPAAGAGLPPAQVPDPDAIYLSDESRLQGQAARIFFPRSEEEIVAVMRAASAARTPLTISGGRTGIVGGAVPQGGWLLSLEKMDRVLGLRRAPDGAGFLLRCQPGVTLESLDRALAQKSFADTDQWSAEDQAALAEFQSGAAWMFPPDPTEHTATLGGMAAANASGARTLFYGSMRHYVMRLRIVLAAGSVIDLRRGQCQADAQGHFQLHLPSEPPRSGRVPLYALPPIKNAAGYFAQPAMDLLDLFIGAEGTLGVFSELEVLLIPAPETILGVVGFFSTELDAQTFVVRARQAPSSGAQAPLPSRPLALEYFDGHALDLLREQKELAGPDAPIPALPPEARAAVYIELASTAEAQLEGAEALLELLEASGSSADTAWSATSPVEIERLKAFRHALPEAINRLIGARALACPGLTKLGTDFAVPDEALAPLMEAYREIMTEAQLEYVIFGHIGNNHLHLNILPRNLAEYQRGKKIYQDLARRVLEWGGTVSAEHGIGKLKKPLLELMLGASGLEAMRLVKKVFDPETLLNPGNIFD